MHVKDLMIHHFTVGVAREYGLNEAVILQNIYYWVDKNATNRRHLHDGRYWTYNSAAAFTEQFPYFTKGQIQYTLKKLRDDGLILVGNYNKQPFDQTRWYALTDKAYALFGQVNPADRDSTDGSENFPTSISKILEMDVETLQNGCRNSSTPIPNRNTYGNSNGNTDASGGDGDVAVTVGDKPVSAGGHPATVEEVRDFVREKKLHIDPERFFEVNQLRGWKTKEGKPIDDWRQYALTWERYEVAREPLQAAPASDGGKPHEPSVDEVMRDYHCDRAMAEELIREHLA